jgi:hypothetical protein
MCSDDLHVWFSRKEDRTSRYPFILVGMLFHGDEDTLLHDLEHHAFNKRHIATVQFEHPLPTPKDYDRS